MVTEEVGTMLEMILGLLLFALITALDCWAARCCCVSGERRAREEGRR